jgi:predicted ATPase/class 3 adenylate cyclase
MGSPRELPAGTVTLMFCDIEGSTALARKLGDGWPEVLGAHRAILRAAVGACGGIELGTEGDGLVAAFARARDAVAAAAGAQRALAAHRWPAGARVLVRMGLHTGEPALTPEGYEGLDMHRGARVMAAGHGGQVLLTDAVRATLGERLPAGVAVKDLGEYALRDFPHPEHVFQLLVDGLPTTFPPLRGGGQSAKLPRPRTRLVGREREVADVAALLAGGGARLVTLTGPGGVGKTRLATEIATTLEARWRNGWRFVSLASLGGAEQVAPTLVDALEVVVEGERPGEALGRWLAPRELLLVIDNFEHVLTAAPLVSELLDAAPGLTVLTTSREPLRLRGEHIARLGGLGDVDGSELFVERAREHDPALEPDDAEREAIAAMCRRLDGLPLAIELTAPWISLLPVSRLAPRLQQSLAMVDRGARDAPARQRTLRATIDWSYNLLDTDARATFAALAVFPGGCTVEAAQAIARTGLHALAALQAKSLVARRGERLAMLETVRTYAAERLAERADADDVRSRHAQHYLELAEEGEAGLDGPDWVIWRRRLDAEIDNFRAAFAWLVSARRVECALTLASTLQPFWRLGSHDREIHGWLDTALSLADDSTPPRTRARALLASSRGALLASERFAVLDAEEAERDAAAALELYRQLGDQAGVAQSLVSLGYRQVCLGRYGEASAIAQRALATARASRDERAIGWALWLRATAGDGFDEVRSLAREAVAHFRQIGATRRIYPLLNTAAYAAVEDARYSESLPLLDEALPAARAADDGPGIVIIRGNQAVAHLMLGHDQEAADALSEQLGLCRALSLERSVEEALLCAAAIAAHRGARHDAGLLAGAAAFRFKNQRRMAAEDLVFRRIQDQLLTPARETDPRTWDAAARAGATLSEHDAISIAFRALEARPQRDLVTASDGQGVR